jgi:hypothetical protein
LEWTVTHHSINWLSSVQGDIMRGYARGRYRDRWLLAAQGEYRSPVRKRLGGVLFAGAGVSAPGLG